MIISIDKNGIAREGLIPESEGMVHWYDTEHRVSQWLLGDEVSYEMDALLTDLRYAIERSVFVANDAYSILNPSLPMFVEETGYRPSGKTCSSVFQWVCDRASCETLNRYIYVQDVWWLADSLNASHAIAAEALSGFFRELSRSGLDFERDDCPGDGLFEVSGVGARPTLKELQGFLLSLHSCLDIATKLLYALTYLPCGFDTVPARVGGNALFRKAQGKEAATAREGTIFEKCWETNYLGGLRDEIMHNRALDASGVAFVRRDGGRVIERFVLLPDADEGGTICSWKNRRRFYSLGLRANDLAPNLFGQISRRLLASLKDAMGAISFDNAVELSFEDVRDTVVSLNESYARFAEEHYN